MRKNLYGKAILLTGGLLLISLCLTVWGYFTVFRDLDAATCIPKVSNKLGIKPDLNEIYKYTKKQLSPGLSKVEVMERLGKIGVTSPKGSTLLADGTIREGVELKICFHPLNNILIINSYSQDGVLLGTFIDEDSP